MAESEIAPVIATRRDEAMGFLERLVSKGLGWARSTRSSPTLRHRLLRNGIHVRGREPRTTSRRFGAEFPASRLARRIMLMVVGTINMKPGADPEARLRADGRAEVGGGVRRLRVSSGGFYDNYAALQGIDRILPVRRLHSGVPATPRAGARRADPAPGQRSGSGAPHRRHRAVGAQVGMNLIQLAHEKRSA